MISDVAKRFVLRAIQEWEQSESEGISAVQDVLNAAGFNAVATCRPVFGSRWPKECLGADAKKASIWLRDLTDTMRRGNFETEAEHVDKCIAAARDVKEASRP